MSDGRKRARLAGALGCFVQQYARKARAGGLDPNDRRYDHKIEKTMRRLRPEELSGLLSGDETVGDPDPTG
ncbi:hypothetical protein [Paraburkholderia sp. J67]|uniref:hypothetical protein n=1 Tax=Paraburkholderia sp. J67 TaxID=2805435 RepID=UPI002ABD3D79|nr:hypothetical protein [Paraburkholderia sp. J67]